MTPEVMAKAFDPFFTTKPIGQGTGLGLSMIYGFTRQSGGYAKIHSEVDRGTTVKLYLPRYYGEHEADAGCRDRSRPERSARAGRVVLVVEDEHVVRDLVIDVLTDMGYGALQAVDGPSGLRSLESDAQDRSARHGCRIAGSQRTSAGEAARKHRPDLKVLFITGYAHNAIVRNRLLEPGMEMITKPFAIETLASRIRQMIEHR